MRRKNQSLIRAYKDLAVTKRDLIDLRESIAQTIKEIKHTDDILREMNAKRVFSICHRCEIFHSPALPHVC